MKLIIIMETFWAAIQNFGRKKSIPQNNNDRLYFY
jgi:hypothetical protein